MGRHFDISLWCPWSRTHVIERVKEHVNLLDVDLQAGYVFFDELAHVCAKLHLGDRFGAALGPGRDDLADLGVCPHKHLTQAYLQHKHSSSRSEWRGRCRSQKRTFGTGVRDGCGVKLIGFFIPLPPPHLQRLLRIVKLRLFDGCLPEQLLRCFHQLHTRRERGTAVGDFPILSPLLSGALRWSHRGCTSQASSACGWIRRVRHARCIGRHFRRGRRRSGRRDGCGCCGGGA